MVNSALALLFMQRWAPLFALFAGHNLHSPGALQSPNWNAGPWKTEDGC